MKRERDEDLAKLDHTNYFNEQENDQKQEQEQTILGVKTPLKIVAPMVDNSDLAFRLLVRRYGINMTYTEMLYSTTFAESKKYRKKMLYSQLSQLDRPLVVQFAGTDADTLLRAAKLAEPHVDAIDLNLGCPQRCAEKGGYGAFLPADRENLYHIVSTLANGLTKPLFCKIRLQDTLEETLEMVKGLEERGAKLITVHGRTKEQKGSRSGPCNWEAIREIKKTLSIPVVSNGGIQQYSDIDDCLNFTGCDGVMSADKLMDNPAVFANLEPNRVDILIEYLNICKENPPPGNGRSFVVLSSLISRTYPRTLLFTAER
eukprot:TRINITY_DN1905_c0_g1_i1.p1 TRINITY_DN1905_c0_g1~~TRINITY_DN1905_c0_g1_i1.p1  ORF type:complete len:330 (-),score=67.29 TRINITY_DN1905_c0_g1_i1:146-1093(-)